MPAFRASDFLIALLDWWSAYPLTFLGLAVVLLIAAWRCAFLSGVKVTRHEMDDREPEPLRRVVLDASARFPPRASDRRAS